MFKDVTESTLYDSYQYLFSNLNYTYNLYLFILNDYITYTVIPLLFSVSIEGLKINS